VDNDFTPPSADDDDGFLTHVCRQFSRTVAKLGQ
jgi:hypothetical protein